jgi:hypothetical protein
VQAGAYLANYDTFTIYFLKQICSGEKKCNYLFTRSLTVEIISLVVPCENVRYVFVPQYKSLSIEKILERRKEHAAVSYYLPDEVDFHRLSRQWVCNVFSTVAGSPFTDWVDKQIKNRDEEALKVDEQILLCPKIF